MKGSDLGEILKGKYPDSVSSGEIGLCHTPSQSIKHFYEETDDPYAVIMEDDCDINIARILDIYFSSVYV